MCIITQLMCVEAKKKENVKGYLHSAPSSSGFVERTWPCAHLGQSRVLAWVDNSSQLLQRSQMHQKNFASFKCWRLFNVPCGEREDAQLSVKLNASCEKAATMENKMIKNL